jgi:hypothetical protein
MTTTHDARPSLETFQISLCDCADPDCKGETFKPATAEEIFYSHPHDVCTHDGARGFWVDCRGVVV